MYRDICESLTQGLADSWLEKLQFTEEARDAFLTWMHAGNPGQGQLLTTCGQAGHTSKGV